MSGLTRYRNVVVDSARWVGFPYRDDDDGLRRYQDRVAELVAPDLAAWAHGGWLMAHA